MRPGAERPKLIWSEWRQMGQITRFQMLPLIAQVIDGALQVGCSSICVARRAY
jgi:hypothetical protein